jgi:hypothetical protein
MIYSVLRKSKIFVKFGQISCADSIYCGGVFLWFIRVYQVSGLYSSLFSFLMVCSSLLSFQVPLILFVLSRILSDKFGGIIRLKKIIKKTINLDRL